MKFLRLICFITLLVLLIPGCVYEKEDILYPPKPCDTSSPSYSLVVQPIISANCYRCHDAANSALNGGGNQLDSHAKLKVFADNGHLVGAITHSPGYSPMPKNSAKLSDCDINKIKAWVDAGAPDN